MDITKLTTSELRTRIMSLSDSINRLKQLGSEDEAEEALAELEMLTEEREQRFLEKPKT